MLTRTTLCLATLALASCAVGPNYKKPDTADITPAKWRWQTAAPRDHAPRGEWWKVFHDSELDRLEARALASSQTLRAAVARVEQARAQARVSAANFLPDIRLNGTAEREQTSGNLPTPVPVTIPAARINSFTTTLDLSYEIDFWGKVRRSFESARAEAAASAADYHNALLILTGDIAANYFLLRSFDAELAALRQTIELRDKALNLIKQRADAGAVSEIDAERARTELATARAELADVKRQRQEVADTLSLLCGEPATNFRIAERPLRQTPPNIPAGLPADLLERRPDIAKAERTVAARNADIGVATAAYFPSVRLTGSGGYLSKDVDSLFSPDSKVWSIGPSVSLPITGFAVIGANVRRTKAAREEAIANYRQAVLTAVKDVETSLAQIRYRREQGTAQSEALASSAKATELIRDRYERGTISFIDYLDAERTRLQLERQNAQISAQRFIATVRLIKALGGGW
ncbi:MAG: efflux transporter outer membrane subunit [Verrucomicrobiae bacterium]|nr:efflux transporter outer membrane subunit [Verrucomicrobiae bacterium]